MVRTKPARRLAFVAEGEEVDQDNIGPVASFGDFFFSSPFKKQDSWPWDRDYTFHYCKILSSRAKKVLW